MQLVLFLHPYPTSSDYEIRIAAMQAFRKTSTSGTRLFTSSFFFQKRELIVITMLLSSFL